jgi:hypothetical protein
VVDAAVGGERGAREGQPQRRERLAQGSALGPVEVEQGAVDVEEDGAEAGQGYLAR